MAHRPFSQGGAIIGKAKNKFYSPFGEGNAQGSFNNLSNYQQPNDALLDQTRSNAMALNNGGDVMGVPINAGLRGQLSQNLSDINTQYASPFTGVPATARLRMKDLARQDAYEHAGTQMAENENQARQFYTSAGIAGQQSRDEMRMAQLQTLARLASPQLAQQPRSPFWDILQAGAQGAGAAATAGAKGGGS